MLFFAYSLSQIPDTSDSISRSGRTRAEPTSGYDYEVGYSIEDSFGDYKTIRFEVKIFNLSGSESMKINIWDKVSYTVKNNTYPLMGVPEDSDGNPIQSDIAPGKSRTVYYSELHKGSLSGPIGFTFSYGTPGWTRQNR